MLQTQVLLTAAATAGTSESDAAAKEVGNYSLFRMCLLNIWIFYSLFK